jgi:hypothetical protein
MNRMSKQEPKIELLRVIPTDMRIAARERDTNGPANSINVEDAWAQPKGHGDRV